MKAAKKVTSLLVSLMLLLLMVPTLAFAADDERIIVYAQVPEDWTEPCIWAWADDGTNAFEAWPGEKMTADENNPGWYYCWIPAAAGNVIINANEGGVQTADQKLEAKIHGLRSQMPIRLKSAMKLKQRVRYPNMLKCSKSTRR